MRRAWREGLVEGAACPDCRTAAAVPINLASEYIVKQRDPTLGNAARFMSATMTNLQPGASVIWVHMVFVLLYISWGESPTPLRCA